MILIYLVSFRVVYITIACTVDYLLVWIVFIVVEPQ
jgi:hypothetical protein